MGGDYESDCLTNLRFACDVLLFSLSVVQLQKMMCDFKQSTESVGLKIHPDKKNVREISWANNSFEQQETAEIKNRIRASWAVFYRYKQELTSISYLVQHRLHLLNMVITPTLSHAPGTWTPSKEHEIMIPSTQRKILASSSTQRENTKRKLNPAGTMKMNETKKRTTEAPMRKLQRVAVQTQITTETATFHSRKTPMKRLTQAKLKKKIGLNT